MRETTGEARRGEGRGEGRAAGGVGRRWARALRGDTWVRPYLRRYRRVLAAALGLGVGTTVFSIMLMVTSGYLISASAEQPPSVFELMVPLGLVQLFGVGKPFLRYVERLRSHDWVLRMTSDLRTRLYEAVAGADATRRAARGLGDLLGLLADDIGHIQDLYLRMVFPGVVAWAVWLLAVVGLGAFSWPFALAALLYLSVLTVLAPLVSVLVSGARQTRAKALRGELYASLADDVLGVADWGLSGRRDDYVRRVTDVEARLRAIDETSRTLGRARDLGLQVLCGVFATLLLLWAGARFGGAPDAALFRSADWVAALVIGFFPLVDALVPLSSDAAAANAHLSSVERLNALGPRDGRADACGPDEVPLPTVMPHDPLDLRLDHVSFAYDDDSDGTAGIENDGGARDDGGARAARTLADVSLVIPAGQHVAVLGPSGAGKSTLLALLRGDLAPQAGAVTLGGVPTREIGPGIARLVGVVQQRTYLFHATLLDNLRVANPDATEAQARAALERVGLGPMLATLPDGLATMVDEAGGRFSGGERHRVALARVLLRDAPIVLLDEPFVSLDPVTEAAVLDTLLDVFADRTIVLVTHHLAGASRMDRVVFLEGGRVAMDGSPAGLAATNERYRRLRAFDLGIAPGERTPDAPARG